MAEHSYTSRRELDQYAFRPAVTVLAPLLCIVLQAMLPKTFPKFALLDLPLIATIFFAVARRNPISGTITGTVIGLLQDGLTNHPFGVNGIAKGIIGYIAASIGFAVDVDNTMNRALLNFGFCLLQSGLLYLISRRLLGDVTVHLQPVHELIRAVANTVVAIPMFFVLDRFKLRE
ncbi:MAG TPA: rod shape-determining protein MreD [Acidobacteriaceae bacterium]|jgi:rod shape-determining protein MreD|nr:rod shape-determining protein MreD [Acidobacteriaceae bacterium]